MPDRGYNGLLNAVIFILLEVAAYLCLGGTRSLQDIWINRAPHRPMAALWQGGENIRGYFHLREENQALSEENTRLAEALRHYEGMERAAGATAFAADTITGSYRYTPATIVKMSRNSQHNYIILDKGSVHGVKPQSAIITPNGVVGMVYSVDSRYSYGLSLLNDKVSVSARIGREGIVAPLVWDGNSSDRAILKDIPLHLTVEVGDTVRTSGISAVYPPDIPIGVTTGSRLIDGSVNVVDVKLFVDFSSLRYVIIAENPDRQIIEKMAE